MQIDELFHNAFMANANYKPIPENILCRKCGTRLKTYYCEGKLYAVKCGYCGMITLVKANNPSEAARYVGFDAETLKERANNA